MTAVQLIFGGQFGSSWMNVSRIVGLPLPTPTPSKTQTFICNSSDLTEDDIPELMQIQVSSSLGVLKNSKSPMVKIVSPSHTKSVIIPTSNPQILKQIQERPTKPVMTQQQFFQITGQNKQKTISTKGTMEPPDSDHVKGADKNKIPVSIQQQIVQGLTTQQLQNIKNFTLLKPNNPTVSVAVSQAKTESQETTQTVVSLPKMSSPTETVTLKTSGNLTPSQTQQIIQSIKQKYMPNANVLTPQQQVLLKQKGCVVQLQKSSGQTKNAGNSDIGKTMPNNQVPVVAKVLTNAAGQVISVESLLAHQKAHGSLPQGTTLRVQGSKPGQQNVIHLTSNAKSSPIAHFTVGTQNNLVALTTQPKLVVASQTTTATTTVTPSKIQSSRNAPIGRNQQPKPQTINQQLVNAKLMATEGQKSLQPKVMVGGQTIKVQNKTGNRAANFNSGLRMLNTANLNLTTLDGKPVLLASKSGIQSLHGQNVIVQTHPNSTPTSSSLVIQGGVAKKGQTNQTQSSTSVLNQSGNIVFSSTAIKNQGPQQVIFSSQAKGNNANTTTCQTGHIVLGNQPIRLQTSNAASGQRVVLASQGQGGQILAQQILLPAGFQGTAINIKSLQGVKVIPIAQNQKGQSRQIIAKVMSPNIIKQTTQPQSVQLPESVTIHSSESE
ncbi:mucin-4-like [Anthonomus grandis grandis]|uniref:mucin-4-like n=1 Tax=Anthonomus grandis grandis TaxID=2921223 RepID=UPI002164F838|nr:mucin-4-like [Anthonomus grandis grandis]